MLQVTLPSPLRPPLNFCVTFASVIFPPVPNSATVDSFQSAMWNSPSITCWSMRSPPDFLPRRPRAMSFLLGLEMLASVLGRMADEVVRPQGREALRVVLGPERAHRGADLTTHRAVIRDHRARRARMPLAEEVAVLLVKLHAAQLRIGRLLAQRAQLLALPLDDVRERILAQPPLPLDARPRAEARHLRLEALCAEALHDAIERAVLGLHPPGGVALVVRDDPRHLLHELG